MKASLIMTYWTCETIPKVVLKRTFFDRLLLSAAHVLALNINCLTAKIGSQPKKYQEQKSGMSKFPYNHNLDILSRQRKCIKYIVFPRKILGWRSIESKTYKNTDFISCSSPVKIPKILDITSHYKIVKSKIAQYCPIVPPAFAPQKSATSVVQ